MKGRCVFGLMLSTMLLLLAAGSGLARGPQPTGPSEAVGASTGPAPNAPWFNIEVDTLGDVGQHTSVSTRPDQGGTSVIAVSYYDATNKDLRVAHYVGSGGNCGPSNSWSCQTVESAGDVGKYSSIAVDRFGIPVVVYHDATDDSLKLADVNHSWDEWWPRTIDKGLGGVASTGLYTSLAFTLSWDEFPIVSYYFDNPTNVDALMVAYWVDSGGGNCGHGAWEGWYQCDTIQVGEGVGQYTSLAVDEDEHMHIAYYDGGNGDLWYATSRTAANCGPGNSWTCYPVAVSNDVGQYASMYVDSANRFHIAYYDATTDMLKYAVNVGSGGNCGVLGSAQCDEIDAMQTGYHPLGVSIAEDAAGYPIIAYQSEWGDLNVARPLAALGLPAGGGNCGPEIPFSTWYCETIDPHGTRITYRNGDFASIALSSSGLATIAYYGFITSSGGNLMVSYQRFQDFLPLVMKHQ
jgi:hypothetical protein